MGQLATRLRINQRDADRYRLRVITAIRAVGSQDIDLRLDSISDLGFAGCTEPRFRAGDDIIVHLPLIGDTAAQIVWVKGDRVGGEFVRRVDARAMVAELNAV